MPGWKPIPRRSFLRGVGTAIALPLLEGMLPTAGLSARAANVQGFRFAGESGTPRCEWRFVFFPNGANVSQWTPAAEGTDFEFSPILAPLAEARDDVLIISGLAHDKAKSNGDGPGDHARCAATFF